MNVNPTILRRVISTKRVSQRLQRDAQLDKVVECDGAAMPSIVLLDEEIDGGWLQTIAHHPQGCGQLALVDETGIVAIVTAECLLPTGHVIP